MKLYCLLLLLTVVSTTVHAQAPADALSPEDAAFNATYNNRSIPTITGKLLNMAPDDWQKIQITYYLVTPFVKYQVTKIAAANPDGTFSLQLDYPLPYQQIWLKVGDYFWAGLYANKDLDIQLDIKKIKATGKAIYFNGEGVRYGGTDGPLNAYLNNYVLYRQPDQQRIAGKTMPLIFSPLLTDSILTAYNSLCDSAKEIQDSYVAANPSPYSWMLENERLSGYNANLCVKYMGKMMPDALWQKIKQHKGYLVSNNSAEFYRCQWMYFGNMPGQKMTSIQRLDRCIQKLDSLVSPARADYCKLGLGYSTDLTDQSVEQDHILNSMHTDWCMSIIKNESARTIARVNEINASLAKASQVTTSSGIAGLGKPLIETSFGASLYKAPDVNAADFMAKLIQAFPGKAIIIDRWATWCGACIGEMPHSKKLQEQSKDLPVVFVYLCTINNSTENKWKSKVMEMEQPGVHILINEKLDAELSKTFAFSGYPGYAFIDKTGSYKPGAITWMSQFENKQALATLLVTTK